MFKIIKNKKEDSFEIIVPATSANLGPGFDSLGLSYELFNHFIVKKSDKYEFINVDKAFQNEDNLVIQAALKTFEFLKKKPFAFSLEIKEEVPVSRGLGSSATCILAGVIGAMLMTGSTLSDEEIVSIATSIEGHPDNVVPAYYGSLTSAFMSEGKVFHTSYDVSNDLIFTLLIPPFALDTKKARSVLPNELSYSDFTYSMSRAISIPKALEVGDVDLLYQLFDDKIHEPYRYPLIEDSSVFIKYAKKNRIPLCISGSGSTLLMISRKNIKQELLKLKTSKEWRYLELNICKKGTKWVKHND